MQRKKTYIAIFLVALALIFIGMMMCMEIRLVPLSEFPSTSADEPEVFYDEEGNTRFWWNSVHLDIPIKIPFTVTAIEVSFYDDVPDQTKVYIYDVEGKHILPGMGRVTLEELFKMYPSLIPAVNQRLHTKEAALYVLLPLKCVTAGIECTVTMEYRWLGILKKTSSTVIYQHMN